MKIDGRVQKGLLFCRASTQNNCYPFDELPALTVSSNQSDVPRKDTFRDPGPVLGEVQAGVQKRGDLKRLSEGRRRVTAKKRKSENKTHAVKKRAARENGGAAVSPPAQLISLNPWDHVPKPIRLKVRCHSMYTRPKGKPGHFEPVQSSHRAGIHAKQVSSILGTR